MGKAIAKFSSGTGGGGTTAPPPVQSVSGQDASTLLQTDPNYHARWQDGTDALHTVINITVSLGNVSYPQTVTVTLNGPSAPGWQGWLSVPSDNAVIAIGLDGTKYDGVFPPTSADEQWTATVDPGRTDNGAPPTSNAKTSAPFTVPAPPPAAATAAKNAWIDRLIVNRAAGAWGWGNLFTDLPFGDPNFKAARWTVQNGHYTNPADPSTFVGGTYAIGGVVTAQHEGQEVPFTDYDANTIYRLPGTDTVSIQNNNPADLWSIPDAVLADGTPNPDNVFRIRNLIGSPLEATPGDDVTWTVQQDWSSTVGSPTPGTAPYIDIVFDLSQGKVTAANVDPGTKLPGQTVPLGQWLGLDGSSNVTLATQLSSLMQQIANASYSIPDSILTDQKILTYNAAQAATVYASGAAAANVLVDSNIAAVQIGKLVSGTVVFSGDVYFAGGSNGPVVRLGNTGVYLYSGSSSGGSGAPVGNPGGPSYYSSGYTSQPYVVVQSTGFYAYYSSSGPCTAVTYNGVSIYSAYNNTGSPYATITAGGVFLYSGGSFQTSITSSQIQMLYGSSVASTLNTLGLIVQNGGNFTFVGSTGVMIGYAGTYSVPFTLAQMQAASYYVQITSSSVAVTQANGPLMQLSGGYLTLYSASSAGPSGNTSSPYVQIGAGTGVKVATGGSGPSLVASASALTMYTVDGSTSYANAKLTGSTFTLANGSYGSVYLQAYSTCGVFINGGPNTGAIALQCNSSVSSQIIMGPSSNPGIFTLTAGFAFSLSFNGSQLLTSRQTGLGSPTGWADATAQSWAQSLYNKLSTHGLIT
jgi:hypothetical protein